jgi:hypothetical protein
VRRAVGLAVVAPAARAGRIAPGVAPAAAAGDQVVDGEAGAGEDLAASPVTDPGTAVHARETIPTENGPPAPPGPAPRPPDIVVQAYHGGYLEHVAGVRS